MKNLTIQINTIKVKGDEDDSETLRMDVYDKLQQMIEDETLDYTIVEEEEYDEI
jgi:hypothetical protein